MDGGMEKPSRAIERGKAIAFRLGKHDEADLTLNQGVVLKDKNPDIARPHQIIKVKGQDASYEVEVVDIQDPSSGEAGKVNYVISFVRKLNHTTS